MKKIIMILTNEFLPDVRVYKEATYLISKGFKVEILCWQRDIKYDLLEDDVLDGIIIKRFKIPSVAGSGMKQLGSFRRFIKICRHYLKKNKCDYLHCNDIDGAIVGYLTRNKKTPMVFDMHEFYEKGGKIKRYLWRKLTIFLLKKSIAGLIENAAYLSDSYKAVHNKLFMLKNYPDRDLVQPLKKIPSTIFRIGYHGAVRSQLAFFVALFEATKNMDNVRVDINGEGPDNEKLKIIQNNYNNVFVHGPFDGTKVLSELYSKTDLLFCGYDKTILNFQGDAEVVKFYEAILTGTPMIMTDGIGMADKVKKNGYGIVCDTSNPNEIKNAILMFMNDKDFWNKCSENEKRDSIKYDWKNAVKVLDDIYRG